MSERVTLFVYDLSQGMARTMSMGLMGRQIGTSHSIRLGENASSLQEN